MVTESLSKEGDKPKDLTARARRSGRQPKPGGLEPTKLARYLEAHASDSPIGMSVQVHDVL